jgi:hypothetical protein
MTHAKRLPNGSHALPIARARVPPYIPRSGGIRPNRANYRPRHLRRGLGRPGDEEMKKRRGDDPRQAPASPSSQSFAAHRSYPASIHTAQRRHPPQPCELPATSPAEGSGEPSGFPSGEPEGRSPLGSARTMQASSTTLCTKRKRPNRQGSPAGRVRGGARSDRHAPCKRAVQPSAPSASDRIVRRPSGKLSQDLRQTTIWGGVTYAVEPVMLRSSRSRVCEERSMTGSL